MGRLDYLTAGESHGAGMVVVVSGVPAGVFVDVDFINAELARRQGGYGRGGRMGIEDDKVTVLTGVRGGVGGGGGVGMEEDKVRGLRGVRGGRTIGSPVTMVVHNKDSRLEDVKKTPPVFRPRPGHADLAGSVKFLTTDCRDVLERA